MQRSFRNFEAVVSEAVIVEARYREQSSHNAASLGGSRLERGQRPFAVYGVKGVGDDLLVGARLSTGGIGARCGSPSGWTQAGEHTASESEQSPGSTSGI